jgi:hypothetical protein
MTVIKHRLQFGFRKAIKQGGGFSFLFSTQTLTALALVLKEKSTG